MVHKSLGLVLLALSAGATLLSGGCGKARTELPAVVPLYGAGLPNVIPNQYFVVMPEGTPQELLAGTEQQVRDLDGQVLEHYDSVFTGFLANLSDQALEHIRRNPNISYIETDRILRATGVQTCTTSWGLDRIDQGPLPLDKVYAYDRTGENVIVHVLDTGIDGTNPEISGRVLPGFNALPPEDQGNGDTVDRHGHGTHLAGIIAGSTSGVAKRAQLLPVKVLKDTTSCAEPPSGPISAVIAGIEWSLKQQDAAAPDRRVLLLSCEEGGNINDDAVALVTAISAAIEKQFVVIASAGNRNADVNHLAFICPDLTNPKFAKVKTEPYKQRIVVGATTRTDQRWVDGEWGSNHGPCVDLFAPGHEIPSIASKEGCPGREVQSGTSQAAAHVAGIAALMLQGMAVTKDDAPGKIPGQVKENIANTAWPGALGNIEKSKNLLAQNPMNTGVTLPQGEPADEDGANDGLYACETGKCGLCNADDKVCADGLGCGGGLQCSQGTCARCGATNEPCCEGKCAANLECANGVCVCGAISEPCCGGTACDPGNIACNPMSKECEGCGGQQQLCCDGGKCYGNNLVCKPGANTPVTRCEVCGAKDAWCCAGNTCLSGDVDCNSATGKCETCGGPNQICCDGKCNTGLECGDNGICADTCGSPNQPCCTGPQACDGGMDCASNFCKGFCSVRCTKGQYMESKDPRLSAGDCATWAGSACMQHFTSAASRIRYNEVLVGGTMDCGGQDEAVCEDTPICDPNLGLMVEDVDLLQEIGTAPNVAVYKGYRRCVK
ncbi:S8 family serine peptidase [Polyangium aurulentum]|uniref:S8 family serine peptidase n=1 Tax=Polyangium aurulentum TaxID=2567896 RepID=UPI00197FD160|nr:S8 family serine peptidase [Polyangium aurulentum]UQA62820.1 S8 family serine peptidase [Polyangium aurulentum]